MFINIHLYLLNKDKENFITMHKVDQCSVTYNGEN